MFLIAIICCQFIGCILQNSRRGNHSAQQNRISLEELMSQDGLSAVVDAVELRSEKDQNSSKHYCSSTKILFNKGRLGLDEEVITKARQLGQLGLLRDPGFAAAVRAQGGRINPAAIEKINTRTEAMAECAAYTSASWSLWLLERGPYGARRDVATAVALAAWAYRYSESPRMKQISGYAVALAESMKEPNVVDWAKVESGLVNAPFNDALQEFEQIYYLRQRDLEAFCIWNPTSELPENYQEWFAQARVDCD